MANLVARAAVGLLALAGVAAAACHVAVLPVQELQSCIASASVRSLICRQALFLFHPTRDEIKQMNETAGIAIAVTMKDAVEAKVLLEHYRSAGVNINAIDERSAIGWTALHFAASDGDVRGVRMLIDAGAWPYIKDANGRTAQDVAREQAAAYPQDQGYREVVTLFEKIMPPSDPAFMGGP